MNEAPGGERDSFPESSPNIRLPWPAVALGLFVFLALVLAAGLYANRNLRPQLGIVATPLPAALATAAPTPTLPPAVVEATIAPSEPTAVATIEAVRATPATGVATQQPTATPKPVVAPSPTSLPTVEPTLAADVGQSYLTFWHVQSQALLELDTTHLPEVMEGDYLESVAQLIDQLRSEGRAIKIQVALNYSVIEATKDAATVVDYMEDNSVYVKIGTDDPISTPTADLLRITYRFKRFPETWKVVDSARSE